MFEFNIEDIMARSYWSQEHTNKPVIEVLFQGTYSW